MHRYSMVAIACGLMATATAARAANESWVSGTGSDAGTCPRTAPCRTFQFAHDQTSNNGAINVLTAGNFGPLAITKPISIVADGVEAVINTGGDTAAITVNAGGGAVVSLRGLTIDLRGIARDGITFNAGGALHIKDCVIRRTGESGILFQPSAGSPELYHADTVLADIASEGIWITPSGTGGARVTLDRVRVERTGGNGINFEGQSASNVITAAVRDSVTAGVANSGIQARSENASVSVTVERSAAVNNAGGPAIGAFGAGAVVRIGDSTLTGNFRGFSANNGGVIESYGTNKVDGNGTDGTPTSTIATK